MATGLFDNFLGGSGGSRDESMFSEYKENRRHSKEKRVLRVIYERDPEIQAWSVEGRTAGFGRFDTKKKAVRKARQVYQTKDMYRGIMIENKNGSINTNQSVGDWQL